MNNNKTAYICGYYNFPRGSASANYVQYLALSLKAIGYKVVLITNINPEEIRSFRKKYADITVEGYSIKDKRIAHFLDFNFGMGSHVKKILKHYEIKENDLLISYSSDCFINRVILEMAKKYNAISIACVVELFESSDFENGKKSVRFWNYWLAHNVVISRYNLIFPISTFIEKFYKEKGCNVCRIPIMADPYEYQFVEKEESLKKKYVYPANGKIKDAFDGMLGGLQYLSDEELNRIELHICGVKKEQVIGLLPRNVLKYIGTSIVIHGWMKYDELIALYRRMDFLLLARETTQMTVANFPSKVPEVMSYGVIPVVSRVGDYTELYLKDGINSLIFDGSGSVECANAIKRSLELNEEDLKMLSKNAFQCAVDSFYYMNWTNIIEKAIQSSRIE